MDKWTLNRKFRGKGVGVLGVVVDGTTWVKEGGIKHKKGQYRRREPVTVLGGIR